MADRIVENYTGDVPEMPEGLQHTLVEALEDGKKMLLEEGVLVPFTMLAIGSRLFGETAEGANPTECYNAARHTVEGARGASAYAFCYDGYLDTNEGTKDAIIVEGGVPGESTGYAIGCLYTLDGDGKPEFSANPSYIGPAPNFMANLKDASEYPDAEAEMAETSSIEKGEALELENAENFGEPVDAKAPTIEKGEALELDNAENFGEPVK